MKKKLLLGLISGLLLAGSITILAAAQTSENFDLIWNALASGGGRQNSANVVIDGILGQTAAGPSQTTTGAGPLQIYAGFYGPDLLSFTVYLPGVMR